MVQASSASTLSPMKLKKKKNHWKHCPNGWYIHPTKPGIPDWKHLMEYLSPHPSYVYNDALLQQGLAPEKMKLIEITKQGPKGTFFFPIAELPKQQAKLPGSIPVHALGQISRLFSYSFHVHTVARICHLAGM